VDENGRAGHLRYKKRYFAIRYLVNSEKISKIVDLKCSGLAVAYCKVLLPLFASFFLLKTNEREHEKG
jgi:hypothetical protein